MSHAFTASPGPDRGGTRGATVSGHQISNIRYHPSTDGATGLAVVTTGDSDLLLDATSELR